jgi:hypothetical protein
MSPDELETLYATLANAIARVGDARATLLLATLALDLIAHHATPADAATAIARAERLAAV